MYNIKIRQITQSNFENEGSFLQTPFWCNFKTRHGWSYKRFDVEINLPAANHNDIPEEDCKNNPKYQDFTKNFEIAVLNRNFAKGLFSIAYVPLMPDLPFECTPDEIIDQAFADSENSEESNVPSTSVIPQEIVTPETQTIEFAHLIKDLSKALKTFLPKNTILIRFDPNVTFSSIEDRNLFNYGMKLVCFADRIHIKKSKVDIQPPDSTLVDLTADEETIMARMHQKWRYNIRLAERKGIVVKKYTGSSEEIDSKIDKFYELTKETNERDGNSSHAKSYYLDLIKSSAQEISEGKDSPVITLYLAECDDEGKTEEIASIMTLFSKTEAIYLYGASSNKKRNLMPNHLLQWTAMKDAKAYGSKYYDMYGMPPEGKDENHPMHGLYMFKTNFGGKIIHRTGSWDVPTKPVIYGLYNVAERIRAFWHKKVMKKIRGR